MHHPHRLHLQSLRHRFPMPHRPQLASHRPEPGYSRVLVAPRPGGGITWARAALETRQGPVSVSWQQEPGGELSVEVGVPESVTALVRLPDGSEKEVGAGQHRLTSSSRT